MRHWPSPTAQRSLRLYNACLDSQNTLSFVANGRSCNNFSEVLSVRKHSLIVNPRRYASSSSSLFRCVRDGSTSAGHRIHACYQSTQAALQDNPREAFIVNEPHGRVECDVLEVNLGTTPDTFKITDTDTISPQPTRSMRSDTLKVLDNLIRASGRRLPRITPTVHFQNLDVQEKGDDVGHTDLRLRLQISNEDYQISCARTLVAAEETQASLEAILVELMQEFDERVELQLQNDNIAHPELRTFPTHRLLTMLELEPMFVDCRPAGFENIDAEHVQLHRAQVYSGHEPLGIAQVWTNPGTAERLARLSAETDLLKRAEQAGIELESILRVSDKSNAKKKQTLELQRARALATPRVYTASISEECIEAMIYTMSQLRRQGLPDEVPLEAFRPLQKVPGQAGSSVLDKGISKKRIGPLPEISRMSTLAAIRKQQEILPIRQAETSRKIYRAVKQHHVLILASETGSGKTTQLPQILLEEAINAGRGVTCNVICTQPRRIAATSVAARVAQERNTHVGGSVGYQVRFDHKLPTERGSIIYSTAGVLLRHLQDDSERVLTECSHIVVDEIHERDLTVDLLLAFLRDLMRKRIPNKRPFPKIVLMSATMKSSDFQNYFSEPHDGFTPRVTSITIPGRMYPVNTYMLDDIVPRFLSLYGDDKSVMALLKESQEYLEWEDEFAAERETSVDVSVGSDIHSAEWSRNDLTSLTHDNPFREATTPHSLIVATVIHALRSDDEGDILIFLPGMKEIDVLASTLTSKLPKELGLGNREKVRLFKLHSTLYDTNASVFEPVPNGCRRLILATNIAQTSITLPSVVHVIDSGKRREMTYDQVGRRNDFLSTWIDQATSIQRRGRAGRLREGHYWAMFSHARFQSLPERASPDILTSDLTTSSLILKSHSNDIDLQAFFARAIDAPKAAAVAACVKELKEMGMLTTDDMITPLGRFCSEFPLHPAMARGLLLGRLFDCFLPLLLVACHDATAPLVHSPDNRKDVYHSTLGFAGTSDDDRYAFVQAFVQYEAALGQASNEDLATLRRKHVRHDAYRDMLQIARQLYDTLAEYGLVSSEVVTDLDKRDSVFRVMSQSNDYDVGNVNLFKALSLSVMNTNIAVWDEDEEAWLVKDLKCMLRPYSVNTMQSLKLLDRAPKRKSGEIVGFGEMVRNVLASPRPFLVETSSITPLMAMLFGGPITLVDHDIIEIDGWLRYRIVRSPSRGADKGPAAATESSAMVVLEFRRALERLLTLASSDLVNLSRLKRYDVPPPHVHGNRYFYDMEKGQPLFLANALVEILDSDTRHWDEVIGTLDE